VHKDSREQFEMRVHKRLIDILDATPENYRLVDEFKLTGWRRCGNKNELVQTFDN